MKRKLLRLIPALLAGVCLISLAVLRLTRTPGKTAEIRQGGKLIRTVSLGEDASFSVYAPGGGSNTVTVSAGRVCVSAADCPDQTCVRQGWVSDSGTPIVCLPHQLTILVKGGEPNVDALAG